MCFVLLVYFIENADATPPHLEVFVRLGCCGDLHGCLQFFALGLLSLFLYLLLFLTLEMLGLRAILVRFWSLLETILVPGHQF